MRCPTGAAQRPTPSVDDAPVVGRPWRARFDSCPNAALCRAERDPDKAVGAHHTAAGGQRQRFHDTRKRDVIDERRRAASSEPTGTGGRLPAIGPGSAPCYRRCVPPRAIVMKADGDGAVAPWVFDLVTAIGGEDEFRVSDCSRPPRASSTY